MAYTPKRLVATDVAVANTTQYTVPSNTTTIIKNIVMCNTTALDKTITITVGSVSIVSGYTIKANDTIVIDLSTVIPTAGTIVTSANATGVNLTISGVEVV